MNKEMHKIINFLSSFKKVKTIAIYTNARFIPKNENFDCLKNPKVILDISDYLLIEKETLDGEEFTNILSKYTKIPKKERTPQLLT